jgi:phage terminase large subunit
MFNVSPVYYENYNEKAKIVINQGGTDSGKTYAIIQLLFTKAITFDAPDQDPIITVIGESVPNLKKGAYRTAKNIFLSTPELKQYIKSWNETDRVITFITGWIMEFISCETEQSAKQGKRQYAFFNEANGISYPIFWQIAKRTRQQTYIDYNPSAPFWAHEKLIGTTPLSNDLGASVRLIISDHRHNPFLSVEDHWRTENIRDKELWRVYARGLTGNLSGLIFPDWKMIPDSMFPTDCPFNGGLDFGYTNDPTAGVKTATVGNKLFLKEVCYEAGLGRSQIKSAFEAEGFTQKNLIFCDHDPEQIRQLRLIGLMTVQAKKGADSIINGIYRLKEYEVIYTESSKNIHLEKSKYMWIKDPSTGKSTNTPIDDFCHLIDAVRYSKSIRSQ